MALLGKVFRLAEQSVESHFWIIISEPRGGKVLAVNITDGASCSDSPCRLEIGDHVRITKPSAIIYRKAREFTEQILNQEVARPHHLCFFDDLDPTVLDRIIDGARVADDLTAKFLAYLPETPAS